MQTILDPEKFTSKNSETNEDILERKTAADLVVPDPEVITIDTSRIGSTYSNFGTTTEGILDSSWPPPEHRDSWVTIYPAATLGTQDPTTLADLRRAADRTVPWKTELSELAPQETVNSSSDSDTIVADR